MAQIAVPFDAGAGATVNEATWQKMARAWLSTGVLSGRLGQLAVTAPGSSMQVSVAAGHAFVEGFFYENDAALTFTLGAANATNPRIDTIVVRLDRTANTGLLAVVPGTPAGAPGAPTLSATDTLFELPLANVLVPAAAGVIAAGNVTDRRALVRNVLASAVGTAFDETLAQESTSSAAFVDLATVGPTASFVAPPSGAVKITVQATVANNTAGGGTLLAPRVVRVSDSVEVLAPNDPGAAQCVAAVQDRFVTISSVRVLALLTPGVTYAAAVRYRTTAGIATYIYRRVVVELVP